MSAKEDNEELDIQLDASNSAERKTLPWVLGTVIDPVKSMAAIDNPALLAKA